MLLWLFAFIIALSLPLLFAQLSPNGAKNSNNENAFAADSDEYSGAVDFTATGDGTEQNPYKISEVGHFIYLAQQVNVEGNTYQDKYFEMIKDITTDTTTWILIGYDDSKFGGIFNGKGKFLEFTSETIEFKKDSLGGTRYFCGIGVFGYANGVIKNFTVHYSNAEITTPSIEYAEGKCLGGIAGYAKEMINCNVKGNLTITKTMGSICGGIVGECETMQSCSYIGNFFIAASMCGGIVGRVTYIENCYFFGQLNRTKSYCDVNYFGGIAGNATTIKNCLINAAGDIAIVAYNGNSYAYAGGIAARCSGTISNCIINTNSHNFSITASGDSTSYAYDISQCSNIYNCVIIGDVNSEYSNKSESNGVYAVTAANASSYKNESTYQNSSKWNSSYLWDFEEIWTIDAEYNSGYPMLKTFCPPAEVNVTIDFNVYVDREFIVYVLDNKNVVTNQLVIKNGSKISFTIKTKTTFTLCVYETLYMTCTIDGEDTRKKEYTPTADTVISVDISGALNVNNWIVI